MPQLHTYLHWGVNRYAENTSKVLAHLVFILKRLRRKWSMRAVQISLQIRTVVKY